MYVLTIFETQISKSKAKAKRPRPRNARFRNIAPDGVNRILTVQIEWCASKKVHVNELKELVRGP